MCLFSGSAGCCSWQSLPRSLLPRLGTGSGHRNHVDGGRRRRQRLITARILDQREGMLLWRG